MSTHVVQQPPPPFVAMDGAITVHQVPAAHDNFVWIVVCNQTGVGAYIDGPDAGAAVAYARNHGLTIGSVFNTHTHWDHIGINRGLVRRGELEGMRVVGCAATADAIPGLSEAVDDGDRVALGAVEAQVWRTDGHLDGHISFLFGDALFCGDTLFAGGCGYIFDGPPRKMFASLRRIADLPPQTRICCAHEYTEDNLRFALMVEPGNEVLVRRMDTVRGIRAEGRATVPSTIAEELATNPFLRSDSREIRSRLQALAPTASLETDLDVFRATRALKDQGLHKVPTPS